MQAEARKSFDYNYLLKYLLLRGRDIYGMEFNIPDQDLGVVMQLLAYFLRDEGMARRMGMQLDKGILLSGPAGCGKRALMHLMGLFSTGPLKPVNRSSRKVCWEFSGKGIQVIESYTSGAFTRDALEPVTYCFHDLGREPLVNYFGAACSIMPEILFRRYQLFRRWKMITHVTTRLDINELSAIYGPGLINKVLPMFNLVAFDPRSADKRH